MATGNFYNYGNGGLNVIIDAYEAAEIYNIIIDELFSEGFKIYNYSNDRLAIARDGKLVAVMWLEYGYYEGANVCLWLVADMAEGEMIDEFEDLISGYNEDEGWYVVRKKFTRNQKEKNKVLKIVEDYTEKLNVVASFDNGEVIYGK